MQDEILEQPSFNPSIRMYLWQWIVAPFFLLIVILAVSNYFGDSQESLELYQEPFKISVKYPAKIRYLQSAQIFVQIQNSDQNPVQNVNLSMDPNYMQNFADIRALPAFTAPYSVQLGDFSPGQTKTIRIELSSQKHGNHKGEIHLQYNNKELPPIKLETTSFP